MNPHQRNKIDISKMSEEEQKIFRLYGKVPNTKDLLQNKFKERKYFDSGDYALSKAGKAADAGVTSVGSQHPLPENIPHLTSPSAPNNGGPTAPPSLDAAAAAAGGGNGGLAAGVGGTGTGTGTGLPGAQGASPVKESSYLHRETSVDEAAAEGAGAGAGAPPAREEVGRRDLNRPGSLSPGGDGKSVPVRWQS